MRFSCLECGVAAERPSTALRCLPCSNNRPRIAAPERVRNGVYVPLRIGGKIACLDCRVEIEPSTNGRRNFRTRLRCGPCGAAKDAFERPIRSLAGRDMRLAIKAGVIPPAKGQACVDCGAAATCYDHRDYTKPLQVEPVCRSCNVMRGPADVWPERPHRPAKAEV